VADTLSGEVIQTLAQSCIRDYNLQVHFYRDYERPGDRRTPIIEVDFVAERLDGTVMPIEVKFRKSIKADHTIGLRHFKRRYASPLGVLVTRESTLWNPVEGILSLPLQSFLLAF